MKELLIGLTRKDFRIDTFRGTGPGGQHRNKTDSCVRITHIESGINASSCSSRSQHDNKKEAFQKLAKKLVEHLIRDENKYEPNNQVIRTYNEKTNTVKDHRSKLTWSYKETIGKNKTPWIQKSF